MVHRHACAERRKPRFSAGRNPRHHRRKRRRQIDPDKAADRRLPAQRRRNLLAGPTGRAGHTARRDRPRHQRGAPGSGAVPAPDGGGQSVPGRGVFLVRPAAPPRHDPRRARRPHRTRLHRAGRRSAVGADHRPAAARRDRARRPARYQIPDLRRTDRLPDTPRGGRAVCLDPPAARAGRHHRLYQPPAGGSLRNRRPRLDPAR